MPVLANISPSISEYCSVFTLILCTLHFRLVCNDKTACLLASYYVQGKHTIHVIRMNMKRNIMYPKIYFKIIHTDTYVQRKIMTPCVRCTESNHLYSNFVLFYTFIWPVLWTKRHFYIAKLCLEHSKILQLETTVKKQIQ